MTSDHFDNGRKSFVAGRPLYADYGTRAAKGRNIWDDGAELAFQAQRQYEAGRLVAAERAAKKCRSAA